MNTEKGMSIQPPATFSSILNRKYNLQQNSDLSYTKKKVFIILVRTDAFDDLRSAKISLNKYFFRLHNIRCLTLGKKKGKTDLTALYMFLTTYTCLIHMSAQQPDFSSTGSSNNLC